MLNKNYSFPFKSWGKRGKETEAFATGQWEVLCNMEKRDLEAVSRLYCKTFIDKMVLLQPSGSCPGVVQSCLGLLETSAQKHVWLQVTGAPGAALDLEHITIACCSEGLDLQTDLQSRRGFQKHQEALKQLPFSNTFEKPLLTKP